ncbi:MAG: ADP-glyceromanno-heptose 6-epimerase [Leptospiraceae bacterium]|nr:ADP-glyceromanno-heptose 6-epimerase [Leptospiraceae bacterium]
MLVVTGGAGFIGSAFIAWLNARGESDILLVDSLGTSVKWKNLVGLKYRDFVHKAQFLPNLSASKYPGIRAIVHLGACSTTTETDGDYLIANNYQYTRALAEYALEKGIRFIYASSGATYGARERDFSDDDQTTLSLRPINRYGYSKQLFDEVAIQHGWTQHITGIKFFNVYGPNEYHKGEMASVVFKAFHQIRTHGSVRLFRSYRSEFGDGEQKRDFVYVKDCVAALAELLEKPVYGIFNMGSGTARSWNDLATAVFAAMDKEKKIEYIPMPDELVHSYQYFTEAKMEKLQAAGIRWEPMPLEEGITDYVKNYLLPGQLRLQDRPL